MAQRDRAKKPGKPAQRKRERRVEAFVWRPRNALMMVAGILSIIVGYFLLGKGSITAAPVLLVLGYCVIVPLSVILWVRKPEDRRESGTGE
jgi:uncharacterized membrane protein